MEKALPILMLAASTCFMTFAWYGHLKYPNRALWLTILISWGIAFFEYCLQVPANRMGHQVFSAAQLKIIAEVLSIGIFLIFAVTYLKEPIKWNYVVSFACIVAAALFAFAFD
jgi:uncharacterized protein (DUF486 family)